jgi:hypothetical protein
MTGSQHRLKEVEKRRREQDEENLLHPDTPCFTSIPNYTHNYTRALEEDKDADHGYWCEMRTLSAARAGAKIRSIQHIRKVDRSRDVRAGPLPQVLFTL